METSIFIARMLSIFYLTFGLALLFNKTYYKNFFRDYPSESSAMRLEGYMALLIGFTIVNFHNLWELKWTLLITITGWMLLLKGIFILLRPEAARDLSRLIRNPESLSPIILILGLIFGYFGFF